MSKAKETTEIVYVTPSRLALITQDHTTRGTIFSACWRKRSDGTLRRGTFRNSKTMTKGKVGGEMAYDPASKGLLPVYDMDKRGYRSIDLEALVYVKVGGTEYRVDSPANRNVFQTS